MKSDENMLKRLFKAASKSQQEAAGAMPFPMQARVLAGWRSLAPESEALALVGMFRKAVICGVLVMAVSIGWSQLRDTHEVPGAVALVNLEKVIQVVP